MLIFRPKFWGQFLTPKMGSCFFQKFNFGRAKKSISVAQKNQFRSHYFGHFLQPFQWQFLILKMSSRFFLKFYRTKYQSRSHKFWLRLVRVLAWHGNAKTTSKHVANVCAAGVHPELRAQTRLFWRRCLRIGARARA